MKKFKIMLAEPRYIKESIAILKDIINEATVVIDKNSMRLHEMDPANVMMVICDLFSETGTIWEVDGKVKIGINLIQLNAVLKNAGKHDLVELRSNDNYSIKVRLIGDCSREYEVPTIDISNIESRIPDLKFTNEINMPSGILDTQVKEAVTVSDSVVFDCMKDLFSVVADDNELKFRVDNKHEDNIQIFSKKKAVAKYSIDYLKKMTSCKKISSKVRIRYSSDYPLRIDYYLQDKLNIGFILAPRIDGE